MLLIRKGLNRPKHKSAREVKTDRRARSLAKKSKADIAKIGKWVRENKGKLPIEELKEESFWRILKHSERMSKKTITVATRVALGAAGVKDKRAKAEIHKIMQEIEKHFGNVFLQALAVSRAEKMVKAAGGKPDVFEKVFLETFRKFEAAFEEKEGRT